MVNSAFSAPTLFNNVMAFDDHNFGLIDFEDNQSSYAEIDLYLSTYDASLIGGGFGNTNIKTTLNISPTHSLAGSPGIITVRFNTPVRAAGIFLCGVNGTNGDPYSGGSGGSITVTLGNGAGTVRYNYTQALTPSQKITGFLGLIDLENGITEFEYYWNRDSSTADNLYFGNNLTTTIDLLGGPTNAPVEDYSLPTFNGGENFAFSSNAIPEPASMILFALSLTAIIRKYITAN